MAITTAMGGMVKHCIVQELRVCSLFVVYLAQWTDEDLDVPYLRELELPAI